MNPTRNSSGTHSQSPEVTHTADTRNPDWESYVPEGHGRTDEQVRADVHELLLEAETAGHARDLSVSVRDGVVTLSGHIHDAQEHARLADRVRAIDSVKELRDDVQVASTSH